QPREQRVDELAQVPAGRRQFDPAPASIEQLGAQRLLELRNLPAQGRLGDTQRFRRAAEMQRLGDLAKVHEVPELEGELILARHQFRLNKYFLVMAMSAMVSPSAC